MAVDVGVDLGTTYTAAAIHREGRVEMVELGNRANTVPSVVFASEDGDLIVGEAALRRAAGEPQRVAREYKRRIGDPTPILLGGHPHTAEALTAAMLEWVIGHVAERTGEPPRRVVVAYPANWGGYKQDLLRDAIAAAGLSDIDVITEPEAAVVHYGAQERVSEGTTIGVYDLGGGTFDSAVVRKTATGVELLGEPEGIERLGGIDFDEAVFAHVVASLGSRMPTLEDADETTLAAVVRVREECVRAKEALSSDTEVSIPVLLPGVNTQVRLTRSEFEAMVRLPITNSIAAFRRAVRGAGLQPDDLDAVLLVGGSSRIPLVAEMVGAELGRPVAVDAHPKHAVALGAALAASAGTDAAPAAETPASAPVVPPVASALPQEPPAAPVAPVASPEPAHVDPTEQMPEAAVPASLPQPSAGERPTEPMPVVSPPPLSGDQPQRSGPPWVLIAVALALLAAVAGGVFALIGGNDDPGETLTAGTDGEADEPPASDPTATLAPEPTEAPAPTPTSLPEPTAIPDPTPIPVCPPDAERCIEMSSVSVEGDSLVVDWDANFVPSVPSGFHAHFYWSTFEANQVGANFAALGAASRGDWDAVDAQPWISSGTFSVSARPAGAEQICVTVGTVAHDVDNPDLFHCVDVPA